MKDWIDYTVRSPLWSLMGMKFNRKFVISFLKIKKKINVMTSILKRISWENGKPIELLAEYSLQSTLEFLALDWAFRLKSS